MSVPKIEEKKEKVRILFKGRSVCLCIEINYKYFAWIFAEKNDNQIAERPERAHQDAGQN